jgi:hypothetical protein
VRGLSAQADRHQVIVGHQLVDGEVGIGESFEEQRQHRPQRVAAVLRVGSDVVDEVRRDGLIRLMHERVRIGLAVDDLAEPAANDGCIGLS